MATPAAVTYSRTPRPKRVQGCKNGYSIQRAAYRLYAYALVDGLGLGKPYSVHGYPMSSNAATGLPWTPATDGLRNIVGHVGRDGIVTVWATTSTVSGNGDTGADPNRLVAVQDVLKDKSAAEHSRFVTLRSAGFGEVLCGVAFTPGTELRDSEHR